MNDFLFCLTKDHYHFNARFAEFQREFQSLFQDIQSDKFPDTEPGSENQEPEILKSEVKAAIMHLKNGKATGRDSIPI
ncbi:jg18187 [Pararge aegeria aegeria]|uniref:Jg18187 protein n=1 Tax=Pararge aegeria aegeria TaxID=348720 RepID=A0A8S4RB61_9NEOP|nr:jg18187 [Pararge aegeria aegeria]